MSANKKFFTAAFCAALALPALFAQTITTAADYFKTVSDNYASIKDYEADMEMLVGRRQMTARVSFKRSNLLRIDFSNPANQVILYNGDTLVVYLPESSAALQQSAQSDNAASLATAQGLSLLSRCYSIQYETGQDAVPLDESSDESVVKLRLYPRNSSESFRFINLAIGASSKLIRRVDALTTGGERFVFDFTNYKLNGDIPNERFIYDPPSSANNYNNFLLSD